MDMQRCRQIIKQWPTVKIQDSADDYKSVAAQLSVMPKGCTGEAAISRARLAKTLTDIAHQCEAELNSRQHQPMA